MGTLFHDALLAQHKDTVVVLDGGQTVGDGQGGAAMSQLFKALSHKDLALVIQCAGGFVQNQDGRVLQKYPGNGDALLLSAGQLDAALAHIGVVAVLQRKDELFRARQTGGGFDLLPGSAGLAIGDVLRHRATEQVHVLLHDTDILPQAL
jgi:hypothetical protein